MSGYRVPAGMTPLSHTLDLMAQDRAGDAMKIKELESQLRNALRGASALCRSVEAASIQAAACAASPAAMSSMGQDMPDRGNLTGIESLVQMHIPVAPIPGGVVEAALHAALLARAEAAEKEVMALRNFLTVAWPILERVGVVASTGRTMATEAGTQQVFGQIAAGISEVRQRWPDRALAVPATFPPDAARQR